MMDDDSEKLEDLSTWMEPKRVYQQVHSDHLVGALQDRCGGGDAIQARSPLRGVSL